MVVLPVNTGTRNLYSERLCFIYYHLVMNYCSLIQTHRRGITFKKRSKLNRVFNSLRKCSILLFNTYLLWQEHLRGIQKDTKNGGLAYNSGSFYLPRGSGGRGETTHRKAESAVKCLAGFGWIPSTGGVVIEVGILSTC